MNLSILKPTQIYIQYIYTQYKYNICIMLTLCYSFDICTSCCIYTEFMLTSSEKESNIIMKIKKNIIVNVSLSKKNHPFITPPVSVTTQTGNGGFCRRLFQIL